MFLAIIVLAALVVALVPNHASAQGTKPTTFCTTTVPEGAELTSFPIASGKLTLEQMADLRLRPTRLRYPFTGYNFHRDLNKACGGSWVLETLPVGTMVLVDERGAVVYKQDCGNRLVWIGNRSATPTPTVTAPAPQLSRWERFWNWRYPWWWRQAVDVRANGGTAEVEMTPQGGIKIKADGQAVVQIVR